MAKIIALIPAAGVGNRFGGNMPKQYTNVLGQPVLFHTLNALNQCTQIDKLAIVLSPEDELFDQFQWPFFKMLKLRAGGTTRAHSVKNGIQVLLHNGLVNENDWILVHDAARCCLGLSLLNHFVEEAKSHPVGAILALPVADTLKHANEQNEIIHTVSRKQLWQAQTPQMFKASLLLSALEQADLEQVTDEASAIEQLGLSPLLIEGSLTNFKLTFPQDLTLAEAIISSRKKGIQK